MTALNKTGALICLDIPLPVTPRTVRFTSAGVYRVLRPAPVLAVKYPPPLEYPNGDAAAAASRFGSISQTAAAHFLTGQPCSDLDAVT